MAEKKQFREDYTTGLPFLAGVVEFMNRVGRVLNNVTVTTGSRAGVRVWAGGIKFVIPGGGDGEGGGIGLSNSAFVATAMEGEDGNGQTIREVKVLGGTVQGLFGAIQPFKTRFFTADGTAPQLFNDYNEDTDELVEAAVADGDWFWLEYDPTEQDETARWSMVSGADLPSNATTTDPSQVNYFSYIPLFRVRLSQPDTGVVQMHYGSVYVPVTTNVVQAQGSGT